ncbi:MAG: hypothetical protein FJ291_24210 [Planctomycetes bacterium]|nr:hypothetical protein [Planctomycetota bacterium]
MAKHPAKCPKCGSRLEFESAIDEKLLCPGCQLLLSMPGKHKLSDKVDPLIGQSLGEFEVVELLGRGGMGAVYRARQPSLDRFVALKVLPRAVSRDASFVERFGREAHAAAAVNHPNIIQVHAVGQDKGFQFIAMELVDGESLLDVLKREGRVAPDRAVEWMRQAAAALAEAHAAGIVHRDIKPSNILLTAKGLIKVADFGLAKREGMDVTVTATGAALGTPLYFPPEMARGHHADPRSDLYSLGATFFHLLAGRPPFEGTSTAELAVKHANDPVPSLRQAAPDVPAALAGVIQRLLRKNPNERFQSAQDLLERLNALSPSGSFSPSGSLSLGERAGVRVPGSLSPSGSLSLGERAGVRVPGAAAEGKHPHPTLSPGERDKRPEERRAVKAQSRKKVLILAGAAAAIVLVVVLILALRPGPSSQSAIRNPQSEIPDAPTPSPEPPSREDANAEVVFRNAQTMAARGRWQDAQAFLDRLHLKYGQTAYYAANRAAIEALQAKANSILMPSPKPEPKKEEPPKPEPKKEEPKPKEKEQPTAKEDEDAKKKAEEKRQRIEAERKKREEAEAKFAEAMKPIESLVASWDFAAALDTLSKLNPDSLSLGERAGVRVLSDDIERRLTTRRDELERLAKLKSRFISKITSAQPPLDKRALLLTGLNGPVVKADDKAITAKVAGTDKSETYDWPSLSPKTVQKLLDLTLDKQNADDWLSAGILLLSCSGPPTPGTQPPTPSSAAEQAFERARSLGAPIDRYLDPLAAAAFARAKALIEGGRGAGPGPRVSEGTPRLQEGMKALEELEKKYASTPWLVSHKDDVASARETAKSGIAESEAEKLYAEAAKLFEKKELFDLKPIIEKLKADFPKTRPVTDETRKPPFSEMAKSTETLGIFITVRQDGKGDFKTIQAAIDAAPKRSLILVEPGAPYEEDLRIPAEKEGITLRGRKGSWPIVLCSRRTAKGQGSEAEDRCLVRVNAAGVSFEGMVLSELGPGIGSNAVIFVRAPGFRLAAAVVHSEREESLSAWADVDLRDCVFAGETRCDRGKVTCRNTIWLRNGPSSINHGGAFENVLIPKDTLEIGSPCDFISCTVLGSLSFRTQPNEVRDCIILGGVGAAQPNTKVDHCNLFTKQQLYQGLARPGKGCFSADPQFRDPANFDYRLKPTSPCRKKASDGGDIGCRFTPEMMEVLEKALELRKKGIIKF